VNKPSLIAAIVAHLATERDLAVKAARAAHAESTDEQSKADNKYDTRGLEASYLAHGQAQQAIETGETIRRFEALTVRAFGSRDAVDLGALVEVDRKGRRALYFIGPGAGGTEIELENQEVLVLTPASPLGQQLMGRRPGDRVKIQLAGAHEELRVMAIS